MMRPVVVKEKRVNESHIHAVEDEVRQAKTMDRDIVKHAMKQSVAKLNPKVMIKNPIMFVVEIGFVITFILSFLPSHSSSIPGWFNITVSLILLFTVLFANFAEALAEGRGKAQADSLKQSKKDVFANVVKENGEIVQVSATDLRKDDVVIVKQGEMIPSDGEVIKGLASVDESAITGESAPVIKEAGGDFCSVTGGTMVVSDEITIVITSNPGKSFIDKMISLVEGAARQKTPNEIALNTVLTSLTLIFLIVVVTLPIFTNYLGFQIDTAVLVALLVCLIPTTIGGLLSAIGIAGMDRVTKFNVLAMSGKAVEAAGDINTIILDKTGTITFGNRMAHTLLPVGNETIEQVGKWAAISSVLDETPEGRSVIEYVQAKSISYNRELAEQGEFIPFKAETRMSGVDLQDGMKVRKGAVGSVIEWVRSQGGTIPKDVNQKADFISKEGGTPLVVAVDNRIYGLIYLKDTVKPGMRERFEQLRQMGIKTVMCTGDNPLTAANMIDLDSNPTKIIEVVGIGKQLLMTRGALTTFSIANDIAKYFAIIPAMFTLAIPQMEALNIMKLTSPLSAILSALLFNAVIIPLLIPLAMKGIAYKPMSSNALLGRNLLIYGLGGVIVPFIGIKVIDIIVGLFI